MTESDDPDMEGSGAGGASLAGYEYQIDVSVWLALDLVLISRLAEDLVLEPASQEDLEMVLADSEPGRLVSHVPMTGYTLIVQAKRRGGDAWTPTTLKTLLEHGSDTRKSAAERLKDPNSRYLLVTSAGVNGEARKLKRRKVGIWPKPAEMPGVIVNGIGHDISGRVAVVANQDDERLKGDIDRLLIEGCRVPNAQLDACRTRLREDARARIAGAGAGRWRREALEAAIRRHEGYLASAPELEDYVHPNNWADLRAAMANRSAAIIIGQSGTGKTLATKMLYDELRQDIPGLARVPIRLGPSQLRDDTTPSPVLYDIEDPWGRFDFDPNSRPWNDQLGDFFAAARPDRMIIATSRLDVALASGALGMSKSWVVALEAENYGKKERQRLYRARIDSLPRDLQPLARSAEGQVLDNLATPLEIQKFFDAMRTEDRDGLKNPPGFVAGAIDRAHQNSIEQTVIEQIEKRDDVRAATVVWALLVANDKLTRTVLREIEDGLADLNATMAKGVSPLVDFFVAARNLRQSDGGIVTYYHPRVEAGIVRTLERHRQAVRLTLRSLIDFLVSDSGPDAKWGAGAGARVLSQADSQFGVKPSDAAAARVDAWLEARLGEGGKEFQTHLDLAARAGSAKSNGAETARFLLNRPDKSFGGMMSWGRPEHTPDWYEARVNTPATKPLVETFIRTLVPEDRTHYQASFADELTRLSPGLEAAFLDAAATAVHYGYTPSADAIAQGALNDIEGFEAIVDIAVDVLTPTDKALSDASEIHLDIINGVYSDEHAQHLSDNDDGITASEFLDAYVERVRQKKGWRHVVQHRHAEWLRVYWMRTLVAQARHGRVNADEFAGAFQACYGTKEEDDLWSALLNAWNPQYRAALQTRIREGSPKLGTEHAALACLLEHEPATFGAIVADLASRGAHNRLIEIGREVAYLHRDRFGEGHKYMSAAQAAVIQLPHPFDDICRADLALDDGNVPILKEAAHKLLSEVDKPSDRLREFRLELDASISLPIEEDIQWALATSDDSDNIAVLAIEAAIRRGMSELLEESLNHRFAHVAARALTAIATPLSAPLPERLLALVGHRASPVRRALADMLKAKPHHDHRTTLIKLAGDDWSKSSMQYGNDTDDYPIAQVAVEALLELGTLGVQEEATLFAIAIDTSDPDVRDGIFLLLAKSTVAMQKKLLDLAIQPGSARVRSSAAWALLQAMEVIDQSVIDAITPQLLATRYEPVASVLTLLMAYRGAMPRVRSAAEELAANSKRRALVLLMIWILKDRDRHVAEEIGAMLPAGHRGVAWALGATLAKVDDKTIADLGDHAVCAEVLGYMKIKPDQPKHNARGVRKRKRTR